MRRCNTRGPGVYNLFMEKVFRNDPPIDATRSSWIGLARKRQRLDVVSLHLAAPTYIYIQRRHINRSVSFVGCVSSSAGLALTAGCLLPLGMVVLEGLVDRRSPVLKYCTVRMCAKSPAGITSRVGWGGLRDHLRDGMRDRIGQVHLGNGHSVCQSP
jgi:hypothetical protein